MKIIKYMGGKYKGLEYEVPDWARFIATDLDGEVYAFEFRPKLDENGWWTRYGRLPMGRCRLADAGGWGSFWDWKDSLVEIE